jgi:ribonuclease HI
LRALALLRQFETFRVVHVRREFNKEADDLANQAMDAADTVGDPVHLPGDAAGQASLF